MGIHIIEPHIIKQIALNKFSCLVTGIYPELMTRNTKIGAYITTSFFADLGTPKRYLDAQKLAFQNPKRLTPIIHPQQNNITIENPDSIVQPVALSGNIHIKKNAKVGPNVTLTGNFTVDNNIEIENTAIFGNAEINRNIIDTLAYATKHTIETVDHDT